MKSIYQRIGIALVAALAAIGCDAGGKDDFSTPVRPQLDQLVLGGELILDSSFNSNIKQRAKMPRRPIRGPLIKLGEILKGSDFFRSRTATLLPLGAAFSSVECRGGERCPGRPELSEALRQAGVDVVSVDAPAVRGTDSAVIRETRKLLDARGICATGWADRDAPCEITLGETRVAVVGMSAADTDNPDEAAQRAKRLVSDARSKADMVVLSVALDSKMGKGRRRAMTSGMSKVAGPDILLGHFDGSFDGVEVINKKLVIHNAGTILKSEDPSSEMSTAFLYRAHFDKKGLSWVEGLPIRLRPGRTRQAFLDEAKGAVAKLRRISEELGCEAHEEFGRLIIDVSTHK